MRTILVTSLLAFVVACGSVTSERSSQLSAPINAPQGQWAWVPVDGAVCGNGSPTGFAVNLNQNSNQLLMFFQGGGACRNFIECFMLKTAAHLDGYDDSTFFSEDVDAADNGWFVTQRNDPNNPFHNANLAFIPYCTGDLHGGHNTVIYNGARNPVYHVGGDNAQLYFQRLAATMPQVSDMWLSGFSAGGFATFLNRRPAAEAFPDATINILDDSGLAFGDAPAIPRHWAFVPEPEDCENCDNDLALVPLYDARKYPNTRVGIMTYEQDNVLPTFFFMTQRAFARDIANYTVALDTIGLPNLHYFVAPGKGHVTLGDPLQQSGGVPLAKWIEQMGTGSPDWKSTQPSGS